MKQIFLVFTVSVMAGASLHAQTKPKLKVVNPAGAVKPAASILRSSLDSFSYALGLNIAKNLQQQGIDQISHTAMQKALDDVFYKRPFLLNDQQANLCIQEKIQGNMGKKNSV